MCNISGKGPTESLSVKDKNNIPPMAIQQIEEEEPLDICAVVKPGNTKEKIAFFAAHQCSNRTSSMKIKSTWDIDERATKRRKKSVDLKVKIQLERLKERTIRSSQPETFACYNEHSSLHYVSDNGNGFYPGRPASVIEMVAFLEQRANALLAPCTKTYINSAATLRFARQSKEVSPASDLFCDLEACEESSPGENPNGSKPQCETVHVLAMVAKLESECLKHQREREMGRGLSRNNRFQRHVGRVFLATGTQEDETEAEKGLSNIPDSQVNPAIAVTRDHASVRADQSWECTSLASLPTGTDFHKNNGALETCQQTAVKTSRCDVEMTEGLSGSSFLLLTSSQPKELASDGIKHKGMAIDCMSQRTGPLPSQNPSGSSFLSFTCSQSKELALDGIKNKDMAIDCMNQRTVPFSSQNPSGPKVEKNQDSSISLCEEPLPGLLFFLQPDQPENDCSQLSESTRDSSRSLPNEDSCEDDTELRGKSVSVVEPFALADAAVESTMRKAVQALESTCSKSQGSFDFLETRFKIQQLLGPPQYMVTLPHHIVVKIFRFLPTKSLVALKCTCRYFKFIIEYYNVRPADSRWVQDPRYKEDPCKKCKKKYVKGDVSLCRWHPKPYCQALPYGPGYWMCCYRSQKGVPGCKLGLHDNHWVPDLRG